MLLTSYFVFSFQFPDAVWFYVGEQKYFCFGNKTIGEVYEKHGLCQKWPFHFHFKHVFKKKTSYVYFSSLFP